jgi:hypothetical protein
VQAADLDQQHTVRHKAHGGLAQEFSDDVESVPPTLEREASGTAGFSRRRHRRRRGQN